MQRLKRVQKAGHPTTVSQPVGCRAIRQSIFLFIYILFIGFDQLVQNLTQSSVPQIKMCIQSTNDKTREQQWQHEEETLRLKLKPMLI